MKGRYGFLVGALLIVGIFAALGVAVRLVVKLDQAHRLVDTAKASAARGELRPALDDLATAARDTRDARRASGSVLWRLGEHMPAVGPQLRTASGIASVADTLARSTLPPATTAVGDVLGPGLVDADGLDLARISDAAAQLRTAQRGLHAADASLAALSRDTASGPVATARARVVAQVADLRSSVDHLVPIVNVVPSMLGASTPQTYLVVLMNTAEARGSGGLVGAYLRIRLDKGHLQQLGAGGDSDFIDQATPAAGLDPELLTDWGTAHVGTIWRDTTASLHFPSTVAAVASLYKTQLKENLDGVIAVDPETAGRIVEATGALKLTDQITLHGPDVNDFVERRLYELFPNAGESGPRQQVLTGMLQQVFSRVTGGQLKTSTLLSGLADAAAQGHVLVGSTNPSVEAVLKTTQTGGALPSGPGPFAGIALNNAGGDKLDYYLQRSVSWTAGACTATTRRSTLTLTLKNGAPSSGLPPYVTGAATAGRRVPLYTDRQLVGIYGTPGAHAVSVTLDGKPVVALDLTEQGHPMEQTIFDLAPGQTRTLVVTWEEPSRGPVRPLRMAPLVQVPKVSVDVPECS